MADSFGVNRDLLALITSDDVHRGLASLARAIRIRRAVRQDALPIWRSFVVRIAH